jgi:5-oxoprolinase (ATP-hydrolysing)
MPPFSRQLSEEGAAIKSFKIVKDGEFQLEGLTEILKESRNLNDNIADLKAQIAANQKGINLVTELIKEYTLNVVHAYMKHIQDNGELAVKDMLYKMYEKHKETNLSAIDYMDDGSKISLKISIDLKNKSATFDFTGTSKMVYGNVILKFKKDKCTTCSKC